MQKHFFEIYDNDENGNPIGTPDVKRTDDDITARKWWTDYRAEYQTKEVTRTEGDEKITETVKTGIKKYTVKHGMIDEHYKMMSKEESQAFFDNLVQ